MWGTFPTVDQCYHQYCSEKISAFELKLRSNRVSEVQYGLTYFRDKLVVVGQVSPAVDAGVRSVAMGQIRLKRLHHGGTAIQTAGGHPCNTPSSVDWKERNWSIARFRINVDQAMEGIWSGHQLFSAMRVQDSTIRLV